MNTPSESSSRGADAAPLALMTTLLIILAVGVAAGRLLSPERVVEPSIHQDPANPRPGYPVWPAKRPAPWPTFSSNDRSRWAAVRALVEEGTFIVGTRDLKITVCSAAALFSSQHVLTVITHAQAGFQARVRSDKGIIFEDGWQSVDKVLRPETLEFYSTKPPLLTAIAAGEYWVLKNLFGWSIVEQRWRVIPCILVTLNILPFALYLMLLARLGQRFARTDFAKLFIIGTAGFGTLMTPFLITFNNHTPATFFATAALYLTVRILEEGASPLLMALGGLSAGFAACLELPATALSTGLFVYLAWLHRRQTLLYFLPAALVPVVALFVINYIQLGQLTMAYAKFGGPWYEYENSHWRLVPGQVKRGIDWAGRNGEGKLTYAIHLLIGHHGVFSLMPVFLLSLAGVAMTLFGKPETKTRESGSSAKDVYRKLTLLIAAVSLVVIGFYIYKSDNYGGWSNGPRWLMWLTPLWLVAMLPALDYLGQRRWGRVLALTLLVVSIASMNYQGWNPWRHPWLYTWMEDRGWIAY